MTSHSQLGRTHCPSRRRSRRRSRFPCRARHHGVLVDVVLVDPRRLFCRGPVPFLRDQVLRDTRSLHEQGKSSECLPHSVPLVVERVGLALFSNGQGLLGLGCGVGWNKIQLLQSHFGSSSDSTVELVDVARKEIRSLGVVDALAGPPALLCLVLYIYTKGKGQRRQTDDIRDQ